MPRLRRSIQKIDGLQTAPIDSAEQDELIELVKLDNLNTNRLFINILTVLYLLPIPLFIHLKHYRSIPVPSFLSICVQICSIIAIRYLWFVPLQGHWRHLTDPILFAVFTNALALYVLSFHSWNNKKSLLFVFPVISSVSSTLVHHWMESLDRSIDDLKGLKYKYKSA